MMAAMVRSCEARCELPTWRSARPEHAVDEELDDAAEDKGEDEDDCDAGEIVLDEVDEVVVPAVFQAAEGSFFLCRGCDRRLNLQCEAGWEHDLGELAFDRRWGWRVGGRIDVRCGLWVVHNLV
jgi:hypothetical protein